MHVPFNDPVIILVTIMCKLGKLQSLFYFCCSEALCRNCLSWPILKRHKPSFSAFLGHTLQTLSSSSPCVFLPKTFKLVGPILSKLPRLVQWVLEKLVYFFLSPGVASWMLLAGNATAKAPAMDLLALLQNISLHCSSHQERPGKII